MAISSSPALLDRVDWSTYRHPATTDPLVAFGWIVTVIVPSAPWSTVIGVNAGGWASTLVSQWSPVDDDTAWSNACVWATAAKFATPGLGLSNGPIGSASSS